MAALFDYQCSDCKTVVEAVADPRAKFPCSCGGVASMVWLKAPGVRDDTLDYHDTQLGVRITSRRQRDDLLKERGLVALGPDEWRRTQSQLHAEAGPDTAALLRPAFEKAVEDIKYGRVPRTETPRIDTSQAIVVES